MEVESYVQKINREYGKVISECVEEWLNDKQTDELICVACGKNKADFNSMICKECKESL